VLNVSFDHLVGAPKVIFCELKTFGGSTDWVLTFDTKWQAGLKISTLSSLSVGNKVVVDMLMKPFHGKFVLSFATMIRPYLSFMISDPPSFDMMIYFGKTKLLRFSSLAYQRVLSTINSIMVYPNRRRYLFCKSTPDLYSSFCLVREGYQYNFLPGTLQVKIVQLANLAKATVLRYTNNRANVYLQLSLFKEKYRTRYHNAIALADSNYIFWNEVFFFSVYQLTKLKEPEIQIEFLNKKHGKAQRGELLGYATIPVSKLIYDEICTIKIPLKDKDDVKIAGLDVELLLLSTAYESVDHVNIEHNDNEQVGLARKHRKWLSLKDNESSENIAPNTSFENKEPKDRSVSFSGRKSTTDTECAISVDYEYHKEDNFDFSVICQNLRECTKNMYDTWERSSVPTSYKGTSLYEELMAIYFELGFVCKILDNDAADFVWCVDSIQFCNRASMKPLLQEIHSTKVRMRNILDQIQRLSVSYYALLNSPTEIPLSTWKNGIERVSRHCNNLIHVVCLFWNDASDNGDPKALQDLKFRLSESNIDFDALLDDIKRRGSDSPTKMSMITEMTEKDTEESNDGTTADDLPTISIQEASPRKPSLRIGTRNITDRIASSTSEFAKRILSPILLFSNKRVDEVVVTASPERSSSSASTIRMMDPFEFSCKLFDIRGVLSFHAENLMFRYNRETFPGSSIEGVCYAVLKNWDLNSLPTSSHLMQNWTKCYQFHLNKERLTLWKNHESSFIPKILIGLSDIKLVEIIKPKALLNTEVEHEENTIVLSSNMYLKSILSVTCRDGQVLRMAMDISTAEQMYERLITFLFFDLWVGGNRSDKLIIPLNDIVKISKENDEQPHVEEKYPKRKGRTNSVVSINIESGRSIKLNVNHPFHNGQAQIVLKGFLGESMLNSLYQHLQTHANNNETQAEYLWHDTGYEMKVPLKSMETKTIDYVVQKTYIGVSSIPQFFKNSMMYTMFKIISDQSVQTYKCSTFHRGVVHGTLYVTGDYVCFRGKSTFRTPFTLIISRDKISGVECKRKLLLKTVHIYTHSEDFQFSNFKSDEANLCRDELLRITRPHARSVSIKSNAAHV
jgi:hypothetical protein